MRRAEVTIERVEPGAGNSLAARLRSPEVDEREAAWRTLYDRHFNQVYRLVCRFGIEPGEVEDLTQKAFEVAFRRINEVDELRNPLAWLRGIVVRVVAQHRRWQRVRDAKRFLLRDLPAAAPPPVLTPEAGASNARELDRARAIMAQLSSKLQSTLVLCDLEECTPLEAAKVLGISVNTVRSRRRLARLKFKALWREQFGDER